MDIKFANFSILCSVFFALTLQFFAITPVKSQSITCSDFTILNVAPDTADPNISQVSIQFNETASLAANYPYVSAVLDCHGDTVATGAIYYFAQLGQTTQEYPVTTSGSMHCLPLSMVFIFGNDSNATDTCQLSFGNATATPVNVAGPILTCYPNPVTDILNIDIATDYMGSPFLLYDKFGKLIRKGFFTSEHFELSLLDLADGLYFMNILSSKRETIPIVKAQRCY